MSTAQGRANRTVRDAEKELRLQETMAEAEELRERAREVRDGKKQSGEAIGITVEEIQGGIYRIPDGRGGTIEVVGVGAFRQLLSRLQKGAQAMQREEAAEQRRDEKLQAVIKKIVSELKRIDGELTARQDSLADAQADTHHQATQYRDELEGLLVSLADIAGPAMDAINRLDDANVYALAGAATLDNIGKRGTTPAYKAVLSIASLVMRGFAYFDASVGLTSLFTPQRSNLLPGPTTGAGRPFPIT